MAKVRIENSVHGFTSDDDPASERTNDRDPIHLKKGVVRRHLLFNERYPRPASTHRRTSSNTARAGLSSGLYGGGTIVGTP